MNPQNQPFKGAKMSVNEDLNIFLVVLTKINTWDYQILPGSDSTDIDGVLRSLL